MRTNIDINDDLIKTAKELSKVKTKKEVVELALENLIKDLRRKDMLLLRGKVNWEGDLDGMREI
jgi:Arc/MetJ family transcription regulator